MALTALFQRWSKVRNDRTAALLFVHVLLRDRDAFRRFLCQAIQDSADSNDPWSPGDAAVTSLISALEQPRYANEAGCPRGYTLAGKLHDVVKLHFDCAFVALQALRYRSNTNGQSAADSLLRAAWAVVDFSPLEGQQLGEMAELLAKSWTSSAADVPGCAVRAFQLVSAHGNSPPLLACELTRVLLEAEPTSALAETRSAFAVANTATGTGAIREFVFERLPGEGSGQLFPAAEQALLPIDQDFHDALFQHALNATGGQADDTETTRDYRVRIEPDGTLPLEGNSAGGAAARGLSHAMSHRIPDSDLIVLASLDCAGGLNAVGHIGPKLRAIASIDSFSTIVVASEGNADNARKALNDCPPKRPIEVKLLRPSTESAGS